MRCDVHSAARNSSLVNVTISISSAPIDMRRFILILVLYGCVLQVVRRHTREHQKKVLGHLSKSPKRSKRQHSPIAIAADNNNNSSNNSSPPTQAAADGAPQSARANDPNEAKISEVMAPVSNGAEAIDRAAVLQSSMKSRKTCDAIASRLTGFRVTFRSNDITPPTTATPTSIRRLNTSSLSPMRRESLAVVTEQAARLLRRAISNNSSSTGRPSQTTIETDSQSNATNGEGSSPMAARVVGLASSVVDARLVHAVDASRSHAVSLARRERRVTITLALVLGALTRRSRYVQLCLFESSDVPTESTRHSSRVLIAHSPAGGAVSFENSWHYIVN